MSNTQESEQTRYNLPDKSNLDHHRLPDGVQWPATGDELKDAIPPIERNIDLKETVVPAETVEMGTGTDNTKSFGDNYQVDMIDQPARANRYTSILNVDVNKFSGIGNLDDLTNKDNESTNLYLEILEFFSKNDSPDDESDIHSLADKLGVDKHKFEGIIYSILSSFLGFGRSRNFNGEYDPEQLKMGVKIEREHLEGCSLPQKIIDAIAEKIAKDHLAEDREYYTKLNTLGL